MENSKSSEPIDNLKEVIKRCGYQIDTDAFKDFPSLYNEVIKYKSISLNTAYQSFKIENVDQLKNATDNEILAGFMFSHFSALSLNADMIVLAIEGLHGNIINSEKRIMENMVKKLMEDMGTK